MKLKDIDMSLLVLIQTGLFIFLYNVITLLQGTFNNKVDMKPSYIVIPIT